MAKEPNKTREYAGALLVTLTSDFAPVWKDIGSTNGTAPIAFWHPEAQGALRPVGSIAVHGTYGDPTGTRAALLVGNSHSEHRNAEGTPAVAAPLGYELQWSDRGTADFEHGSIWRPLAPEGYVSLGDVAQAGCDTQPRVDRVWCVRADLVAEGAWAPHPCWVGTGSGSLLKVAILEVGVPPEPLPSAEYSPSTRVECGTFRLAYKCVPDPDETQRCVLLLREDEPQVYYDPLPALSRDAIPSKGTIIRSPAAPFGTMPFTVFLPSTDARALASIRDPFRCVHRGAFWVANSVYANNSAATVIQAVSADDGRGDKAEEATTLTLPPYHAVVAFSKGVRLVMMRAGSTPVMRDVRCPGHGLYLAGIDLR